MYDNYRVYVLRYWKEANKSLAKPLWHFVLEDIQTKERKGFASLNHFVTALKQEIETSPKEDD